MKNFVIYARKSTESEDRQVLSIESQVDEMNDVASKLGLNVTKTYKEAQSASKLGRPKFAEMMQEVLDGKIDGILCWKLDRLARNPIDGGQVIWALKEQNLVIQTPAQLYSADKENSIMLYLEFGMAQKYTDDLSKNVKRGNMQKAKQGGWGGVAPIGYLNKLDDNTVILDPERAPLIRKVWEMILNGKSPERARNVINNELGFRTVRRKRSGGRPLSYSGMYRLLRNPFYYGWIRRRHDGELMEYQGAHEPIINKQEFWEVQRILGEPVPRPQVKEFAYTGLIRCGECGCHFTAYEVIKKSGKSYIYYRCTNKKDGIDCKQPQLSKKELEGQIVTLLEQMTIPPQFADWAIKWLRYIHEHQTDSHSAIRNSLQETYNDAQKKIDKLTDILVRELISEEEYKRRKEELLEERACIKSKLDDQELSSDSWIDRMEKTFAFAKEVNQRFASDSSPEARRTIVTSLGSNFQILDKKLTLDMEPVWSLFSEHSKQLYKDLTRVKVDETGVLKENTTATLAVVSSWQGRRGSNPE
ncbi:recombinase family protein [Patescibacteria group bacterium]|nr:MAG: recombinase family protein [Patescibacteria group bacterium]